MSRVQRRLTMNKRKRNATESEPTNDSIFGSLTDIAAGLAGVVADQFADPLQGLVDDVRKSVRARAADGMGKSIGAGLRTAKKFLSPALRLMSRVPDSLDSAARALAEDDNEDWTALGSDAKNRYRDQVISVVRGFERWLNT